ncbi:aspartate aminotransferase family protein [Acinetobacter pittii]|uniref:class-III pyridoxal-phosphate-dependent aminotransferase n=1 Tax=Acinetobacter pittii TaxID=48296 RepID=UPI001CD2E618|nr:aspartate aminotransferase family protein [Acinetobacter pittii]
MNSKFENLLTKFKGDGPYLFIDNQPMIDAASGTFNLPLGYTHPRLSNKLKQQIDRCAHLSSAYTNEMSQEILKKLTPYLPSEINRIWLRDVSGSGAVECAIRMAQKFTGRSGVITLYMAHHGQSLATAQISGNAFRIKDFQVVIPDSLKIPLPSTVENQSDIHNFNEYIDLDHLIEFGSNKNIACLIIEPILGNGGNIVIPQKFYSYLREFCDRHNIVLVADEVQTGFGRTGAFFASNGYAKCLNPDIIVFAKGAGGIGIPVGGVLMKEKMDVLEAFEHSSTSGANPLSLVALDETISIIEDEKILENVQKNELYLKEGLLRLQEKYLEITNVRGLGYMYGFDTPSPEFAAQCIKTASSLGLIIRGARYGKSSALKVRPPLICERAHLDEILNKLDQTFNILTQVQNKAAV